MATVTGKIERQISPGLYLLIDAAGRYHRAASQTAWRRGNQVTAIDGQIIGRAVVPVKITIYEV